MYLRDRKSTRYGREKNRTQKKRRRTTHERDTYHHAWSTREPHWTQWARRPCFAACCCRGSRRSGKSAKSSYFSLRIPFTRHRPATTLKKKASSLQHILGKTNGTPNTSTGLESYPSGPGRPRLPGRPGRPGRPSWPLTPGVPSRPMAPFGPSLPSCPSAPDLPSGPRGPGAPGGPFLPLSPSAHVRVSSDTVCILECTRSRNLAMKSNSLVTNVCEYECACDCWRESDVDVGVGVMYE